MRLFKGNRKTLEESDDYRPIALKARPESRVSIMAKRNSVDAASVISTLSAGDVASQEQKARILASIPAPVYDDRIDRSSCYASVDFNVRDADAYGIDANKNLYASLKENGLLRQNPMTFSVQPDGRKLVIAGNLRFGLMTAIDNEPGSGEPFRLLHGLVYSGLTREQEIMLMTDHQLSKGLNEAETAKAIGEFWESYPKMTDAKVGIYFGIDKSKAQRLRMVYSMPTVLHNFRLEKAKDATAIKVDQKSLTALYSAYSQDRAGGTGYRTEGPAFRAAWKVFTETAKNPTVREATPVSEDRANVVNQATSVTTVHGSTPEMVLATDILLWAAKEKRPDGSSVVLPDALTALRSYCDDLRSKANA